MRLIIFSLLYFHFMPSFAQQAFYIYRNDGVINAFTTTEIDSMTYSRIDVDSLVHSDYVVHEVYTPDSIYRIPIELIDSVGFITPETKYMPGVIVLEGELRSNILSRNQLNLLFKSSTPTHLLPQIGDKLVSTVGDEYLESAFIGRVAEIKNTADGVEVVCEPVDLLDVFECYYGIIKKENEPVGDSIQHTRGVGDGFYGTGWETINIGKLTWHALEENHDFPNAYHPSDDIAFSLAGEAKLDLSITPTIDYSAFTIITKDYGINFSITAIGNYTMEEYLTLCGNVVFNKDIQLFEKSIPIPQALIDFYFEAGVFLRMSGDFSLEQTWSQKFRHTFHWEYNNKNQASLENINDFRTVDKSHKGKVALNGNVSVGGYGRTGIAFITESIGWEIVEAGLRVEGGMSAEGTYVPYKKDKEYAKTSTDLYNQIKDRHVALSLFWNTKGEAKLAKWSVSHEIPNIFRIPFNGKVLLAEIRSVPLFSDTKLEYDGDGSYFASTKASGNLFNKTDLGFALINDKDKNDATYSYTSYDYEGSSSELYATFYNISDEKKYTLYPLVKYMDLELIAEPSINVSTAPLVSTGTVTDIEETSAIISGYVEGLEYSVVADAGICYSTTSDVISGNYISSKKKDGDFSIPLSGLDSNTTYFYCAYANCNGKYYYGEVRSFTTPKSEPIVTTGEATNIEETSATCSGMAELPNEYTLCSYGICYSAYNSTPTIDNSSVLEASGGENFSVALSDLKENTYYYYRAYLVVDDNRYYGEVRGFTTKEKEEEKDEPTPGDAIDLGLSVMWASRNVGANNPEDYGDYFAWGETSPKANYDRDTYKYFPFGITHITKYCTKSSWGAVDNKTVLDPSDDAATANWGSGWRMPTQQEMEELSNKCTWTWTTLNGVNGMLVTGPNGNSIFLPAAGCRSGTSLNHAGSSGWYWSSSLDTVSQVNAFGLYFYSGGRLWGRSCGRSYGHSVRPVRASAQN